MAASDSYWQNHADIFANFYDHQANPFYFLVNHFVRQRLDQIATLTDDIDSKTTLADIGCGSGLYLALAQSRGAKQIIGIDYSQQMLDLAKHRLDAPNIQLKLGDAHAIPLKDNSINYVFAIGLLDYVDDLHQTMSELTRILKPKGHAILTIPKTPSPVAFSRHPLIAPLRRHLLGLPPLTNILTHHQVLDLLDQYNLTLDHLTHTQQTMWLIKATLKT